MKRWFWSSLALLTLLTIAAFPVARRTPPPDAENGYVTRTYRDAQGRSMTYYFHSPLALPSQIPCDAQGQHSSYPLVLLLHGGGERGHSANSPQQNRSTLVEDPYVKQWTSAQVQLTWPSFIVVPQLLDDQQWVNVPSGQGAYHLAPQPTTVLLLAKETVDALLQQYAAIDAGRLYITGISIGGYGVWDAIERWQDAFAAAAPVSGGADLAGAAKLTRLPIWAFHGGQDGDPSPTSSQAMIQAIRAAGGHPRYTEYPQAGHDIWLRVYTSPAFLSWLFAQAGTVVVRTRGEPLSPPCGMLERNDWVPLALVGLLLLPLILLCTRRKHPRP